MADKKKTSIPASEPAPVAKSVLGKLDSTSVSNKRSLTDNPGPAVKDWGVYLRRVFMARGAGEYKEKVKTKQGTETSSFCIIGTFCDGEVLVIQVWADYAKEFSDLFTNYCEPDGEPTLWLLPVVPAYGYFLRPCEPAKFNKDFHNAKHGLRLSNHQDAKSPELPFTNDAFPLLFDWADGKFELNNKPVPHFRTWPHLTRAVPSSTSSPRPAYVPAKLSYEDASPVKKPRVPTAGDVKKSSGLLDLEDEE